MKILIALIVVGLLTGCKEIDRLEVQAKFSTRYDMDGDLVYEKPHSPSYFRAQLERDAATVCQAKGVSFAYISDSAEHPLGAVAAFACGKKS